MRDVAVTMPVGKDARFDTFAGELGGAMAESGEKTALPAIGIDASENTSWSWDEKWTWKHPNTFLS